MRYGKGFLLTIAGFACLGGCAPEATSALRAANGALPRMLVFALGPRSAEAAAPQAAETYQILDVSLPYIASEFDADARGTWLAIDESEGALVEGVLAGGRNTYDRGASVSLYFFGGGPVAGREHILLRGPGLQAGAIRTGRARNSADDTADAFGLDLMIGDALAGRLMMSVAKNEAQTACAFILETSAGSQVLGGPGQIACPFAHLYKEQSEPVTQEQMRAALLQTAMFVGDLDHDSRLDLWIGDREGGDVDGRLFLSSLAPFGALVGEAARFSAPYPYEPV